MWEERLDEKWEGVTERTYVCGYSPDERYVAGQWGIFDGPGHAAVWDRSTRKLAWKIDAHMALCWVGPQILALSQSKKGADLAWYRWADRKRLGTTNAKYPHGALTHAPRLFGSRRTAAVIWIDQTEGGIELFRRSPGGWNQLEGAGYYQNVSSYVGDALFSADDARYVAFTLGAPDGWDRKKTKTKYLGAVVLIDTRDGRRQFVDLDFEIAPRFRRTANKSPVPVVLALESSGKLKVRLQTGKEVDVSFDPRKFERLD
jgi:hypothetical protein